jgi:hypothetical protein
MPESDLSVRMLADATEMAGELLEELQLDAYLFEVEPRDGTWALRIECAHADGWQVTELPLDVDRLLASRTDADERRGLLESWGERLAACRRESGH